MAVTPVKSDTDKGAVTIETLADNGTVQKALK